MALVEIPPYVLSGDPPPGTYTWLPAFHTRSYYTPPVVEFPRELFADALAEHARLVDSHLDAILTAPFDPTGDDGDDDEPTNRGRTVGSIDLACTLLASDGGVQELQVDAEGDVFRGPALPRHRAAAHAGT